MSKKILAQNKKIENEYEVSWSVEAGLSLLGYQVKYIRGGKVNVTSAHGYMDNGSIFIRNLFGNHDPFDVRLLLKKREIKKVIGLYSRDKRVMVIGDIYDKNGIIKVTLILGERFAKHDHRRKLIEKDERRNYKFRDFF